MMTCEMMDAAKAYIQETGAITFHYDQHASVWLGYEIDKANGPQTLDSRKRIADKTLLKVAELMA